MAGHQVKLDHRAYCLTTSYALGRQLQQTIQSRMVGWTQKHLLRCAGNGANSGNKLRAIVAIWASLCSPPQHS